MNTKIRILFLASFAAVFLLASCSESEFLQPNEQTKVAIQPFENFSIAYADTVRKSVSEMYGIEAVVLDAIEIPKNAFVNIKSPRYRADTLIYFLKDHPDFSGHDHIIGLISKDISTTKYSDFKNKVVKKPESKYTDWGIFGLGFMPGKSCIISSYRLEMNTSKENFVQRLKKISCHELGHNFGLPHCPNKECIMQDAAETIQTIDNVSLYLCEDCRNKIGLKK